MNKIFLFVFALFLITGCGFKVVDDSQRNFSIESVNTTSNINRLNYLIKKNLNKINSSSGKIPLQINLNLQLEKNIYEEDNNKIITKYALILKTNAVITNNDTKQIIDKFTITHQVVYNKNSSRSTNIKTEQKLYETLSLDTTNSIFQKIKNKLNDI